MPRQSLLRIYKAFIRPHLDYGDIIHDQAYNASFHENLESVQRNAALGTIRGTSREKLSGELGLENRQNRRWYRKLSSFYEVFNDQSLKYLFKKIPQPLLSYSTKKCSQDSLCTCQT